MKSLLLSVVILVSVVSLALAETYTGVVSQVKPFASGGTAVDMDGTYPNQKMVLYVATGETKVSKMPVSVTPRTALTPPAPKSEW